jgi:hypothetical protein
MTDRCPECGTMKEAFHVEGCDLERCPHCGLQALMCEGFDTDDPRRIPWSASFLASPSAVSSACTLALHRIMAAYPVRRPIRERPRT